MGYNGFGHFFWLVQGRTISAKGGRAGIELGIWDMGVVSFFDIGMQTHICSPNGGQMERDIRAIPPTGKSPGPTYLYPPPPHPIQGGTMCRAQAGPMCDSQVSGFRLPKN